VFEVDELILGESCQFVGREGKVVVLLAEMLLEGGRQLAHLRLQSLNLLARGVVQSQTIAEQRERTKEGDAG
jgi:hypothetical protein